MRNIIKRFKTKLHFVLNNRFLLLLILWALLTALNINKAYHIDDTFHLEAANWIKEHPATPMSGTINWKDDPTPIYSHNQPPLFFYLLALVISVTGTNEIPLHLFLSVFTFLALFLFDKIISRLKLKNRTLLLLLFAFNPALVVNQNLMTDVPLLSLVLGSAFFLLKAAQEKKATGYIFAALLLGIGLLIKYSILPLLVVLLLVIIIRRDYKYLAVILIPIGMLLVWSVWNYFEYGSVHFLDRPKGEIHINRLWSFMAAAGAVSFFTASMLYGSWKKSLIKYLVLCIPFLFLVQVVLFASGIIPETVNSNILNVTFVLNGLLLFFLLVRQLIQCAVIEGLKNYLLTDRFIILLFAAATSAFMVLFAPFMATRHILLILPFVLLYSAPLFERSGKIINRLSVFATLTFGLFLGVSDYSYADYYRKMASEIKLIPGQTTWTAGHWGWQWYAEKRGLKTYSTNNPVVKSGDLFVYPANISRQEFNKDLLLVVVEKKWKKASLLTFFSGNNFASMYSSSVKTAPWSMSLHPVDTIYFCRVANPVIDSVRLVDR
ncbi:MAG: hypothetical protein HGA37_03910 [Lentimicrobium sp.]|nr:hypothetical protein [Lentimicrobium sp.]